MKSFSKVSQGGLGPFQTAQELDPQRTTSDLKLQTWERARRMGRGERIGLLGSPQRPQGFSCQAQLDFCQQLFGPAAVDTVYQPPTGALL